MFSEQTKLNFEYEKIDMYDLSKTILQTLDQKLSGEKSNKDIVWLFNRTIKDKSGLIMELKRELTNKTKVITVTGAWETTGYSSLASIIRNIIFFLQEKREISFLKSFSPEILYLFPDLEGKFPFENTEKLEGIALSPSRRRLHKESEQMFRVTQMIVNLLLKYNNFMKHGMVILFDQLEKMDEHTIRCFTRLAKCINNSPVVIVASVSDANDKDPRFGDVVIKGMQSSVSLAENRNRLLEIIYNQISPQIYEVNYINTKNYSDIFVKKHTRVNNKETQSTEVFLKCLESGCTINLDQFVIEALEVAVFTQNYEHALYLVNKIGPFMKELKNQTRVEILVHIAICYAFMLEYQKSLEIFEDAMQYVDELLQKVELQLYIGLLYTKRLKKPLLGRSIINEALQSLEGLSGSAVEVERTWLHNLKALTYVEVKDLNEAYINCRKGLDFIKNGDGSENAIHIKINLISNITVLYEYKKRVDLALKIWMKFDHFIKTSSPIFAKHYLYRKAGLLYKLQKLSQASHALKESYNIAKRMNDYFHMDIIARSLGAIYYDQANYFEATKWFEKSLDAKTKLLQDDDIPRIATALALCLDKLGDITQGKKRIEESLNQQSKGKSAKLAKEVLKQWNNRNQNKWQSFVDWAIQKPDTKLNRPFDITNLYCEG